MDILIVTAIILSLWHFAIGIVMAAKDKRGWALAALLVCLSFAGAALHGLTQ